MPVGEHGQLTTSEGIHIDYQWSYTDAAARAGASGFVATDVGKKARQLDDNTLWMLTATTPTWVKTGGPDSAIDHGGLTGLTDIADHPGYLDLAGTRPMTGSLNVGDNNITNVGDIALDSITTDNGTTITVNTSSLVVDNNGSTNILFDGYNAGNDSVGFQLRNRTDLSNSRTLITRWFSTHSSLPDAFGIDHRVGGSLVGRLKIISSGDLIYSPAGTDTFVVGADSDVGIGTTSPSAQLHVDQSSATGAQPVLYLDQADVSEEIIEIASTEGTGNAVEAVGAKTLTTTHFIKITLNGATRYIPCGTIA